MSLLRLTNGFDKLSDNDLEAKANSIIISLTGNADFPTPSPTLTVLQTASDNFTSALSVAKNGSPYEKAVKNQKRAELITLLHSEGNYVLFTCNGDFLKAKSSGFSIAQGPTPAPPVMPASNQMVEDGPNAGEVDFSFDKVPGAKSYVYQYTPDPVTDNSVWQAQVGTVRKVTISALNSGKKYWFRVVAIGTNGQGVYSNPVARMVQ